MCSIRIIIGFVVILFCSNVLAQGDLSSPISTCTAVDEICTVTDGNVQIVNDDFEKHIGELWFKDIDHFGAEEFHMAWGASFPSGGKGTFDGDIEIYNTLDLDLATHDDVLDIITIDWSDDWVDVHIVQEIVSSSESQAHIRETISFTRTNNSCGPLPEDGITGVPDGSEELCDFWFTEYTRWDLGGSSIDDSAEWDGSRFVVTDGDWTATVTPSVAPDHVDVAISDDGVEEEMLVDRPVAGHLAGSTGPVGPSPDDSTETGHAAEFNLRLGITGTTTISFDKIITFAPQIATETTFLVTKDFTDGVNPTEVAVTLNCFMGLPITQTQTISETQGVTFTILDYVAGELNCNVTEDTGSDELIGYTPSYTAGGPSASNNVDGCNFTGVEGGAHTCHIQNNADAVDVVIEKLWVIEGEGGDDLDTFYQLTLFCEAEIEHGQDICAIGNDVGRPPIPYYESCRIFEGNSSATFTASVIPKWPESHCWVFESNDDSAVVSDNDCTNLTISHGQGDSCIVTNTVFFEGIPTLDRYGLALLVLIMLGAGFVGFRRFV